MEDVSDTTPDEAVMREAADMLATILLAQVLEVATAPPNPDSYGNEPITSHQSARHHEQDLSRQQVASRRIDT